MVRYAQQPDEDSCGPTVILNALKWAGVRCTVRKDFERIAQKSEYSKEGGLPEKKLARALTSFGDTFFTVRQRRWRGIAEVKRHLENPKCAVVTYYTHEKGAHVTLVIGVSKTRKAFLCANYHNVYKTALAWVPQHEFAKYHSKKKTAGVLLFPAVWFLTKIPKKLPPRRRR